MTHSHTGTPTNKIHHRPEVAARLNITIFDEGGMTDHTAGESATLDLLEDKVYAHLERTMGAAFTDKTEEEKQDMCKIHRGFCYEHKIDNLCKEVRLCVCVCVHVHVCVCSYVCVCPLAR